MKVKRRKQLLKIKTWGEKTIEKLTHQARKPAVLVKVRSMFPDGGNFFLLRGSGDTAFSTQADAHKAWKTLDEWKL
jgi:hypothetical protein